MFSLGFSRVVRSTAFASAVLFCFSPAFAQVRDPDALWKIVDGQCVPHDREHGDPSPCVLLDQRVGAEYAILKDRKGVAQFLLVPTTRLSGVESPELLADESPNYWDYAWRVTASVQERLHRTLARDQMALAINSAVGRSQNQLHIHIDCIRPDIHEILHQRAAGIGDRWAPLGVALDGHPYWARRILGADLGSRNPFKLLADEMPSARQDMGQQTLVLTGATFPEGGEGFILLADHANLAALDKASGEELLDHDCAIGGR